mmetsp:Transcript_50632/g.58268  ORF Transcript_50632/g.58268 Transcript_50632/m.58268 type:complete len:235 (-) Transcript_50632:12-716(-)
MRLEVTRRLLLLVLLGGLLLGLLQAGTQEADGRVVLLQEGVHVLRLLLLRHLAGSVDGRVHHGTDGSSAEARAVLNDGLLLSLRGLASLDLLRVHGEQNQLAHVRLQALDVRVQGLLRDVLSASVDTDADRVRVLGLQAGAAQLLKREAAAKALLHVVADRGARNLGAQGLQGAGEDLLGLLEAQAATADLLSRLVQEDLDVTLLRRARVEVLLLVNVGDRVVSLGHPGLQDRQ